MSSKLFPEIEPYNSGYIDVSDIHRLYYEEVGNKNGTPIVVLHGGPGGGVTPQYRQFFDPNHYRVILFDQRGAGKSIPVAELKDNNTQNLIDDIEKIRNFFNIDSWIVFGGSWGSTLALLYAIHHKNRVNGLILRGIFLGRKKEIDWLYKEGASKIFPDRWLNFKKIVQKIQNDKHVEAYYKLLTDETDKKKQFEAAKAWSIWEYSISKLLPSSTEDFENNKQLVINLAKIECHFFVNKMFLNSDNFIIDNLYKILDIPCRIVQGRYDVVCPSESAWELNEILKNSKIEMVPDSGHSALEIGISNALVKATEEFKTLIK